MKIESGARSLRVEICDGRVHDDDGATDLLGRAHWARGLVLMAGDSYLPPSSRLEVLAHEFCHLFEWSHGKPPADDEERADWFATAFCTLSRQLAKQGGETALRSLKPGGGLMTPAEAVALGGPLHPDEPYATACPDCEAMIGSGSVVRSIAVPHETGRRIVWLQMMCGDCGKLWRWATAAHEDGGNTAAVVVEPVEVTDRRDKAEFAMKFPKQAGVIYA